MNNSVYANETLPPVKLLEIFPESIGIISMLLLELTAEQSRLTIRAQTELEQINAESQDEAYRYFWLKWLSLTVVAELIDVERSIARLNRTLSAMRGDLPKPGHISDVMIQAAREVPIEDIINRPLRRSGRTLSGLCPFHDERRPSFHVYPETNRYWCFGCNQGGDSINVMMLLQDCSFKEAVQQLGGRA